MSYSIKTVPIGSEWMNVSFTFKLFKCTNTNLCAVCSGIRITPWAPSTILPELIKAVHFIYFYASTMLFSCCICASVVPPTGELAECTRLVHSPVCSQGLMIHVLIHVSRLTLPSFPVLDNQSIVCLLLSLPLFCAFPLICLHSVFWTFFISVPVFFFFVFYNFFGLARPVIDCLIFNTYIFTQFKN